jgi:hypothetical protein
MANLLNFRPDYNWKSIIDYYSDFSNNMKYNFIGNNNNTFRVAIIKNEDIPSSNLDDFLNNRSLEIKSNQQVSYLHQPNKQTLFIKNITTKEQLEISIIEHDGNNITNKDTIYLYYVEAGGQGASSVNGVFPDINGNIFITGEDIPISYSDTKSIKDKIDEIEQINDEQNTHLLSIDNTLEQHEQHLTTIDGRLDVAEERLDEHDEVLETHQKHLLSLDNTVNENITEINRLQIPFFTYRSKKESDINTDWAVLNGDKVESEYLPVILPLLIAGKYKYISEQEWLDIYNNYNGYVDAFGYVGSRENPTYIRKPNLYDYDNKGDVGNTFTRANFPTTEANAITLKRDCYIYIIFAPNNNSRRLNIKRPNSTTWRILEYNAVSTVGLGHEPTYKMEAGTKLYADNADVRYELREIPIDRTTKYVMYFEKGYNDGNDSIISLFPENYPIFPKQEQHNQTDYSVDTHFLTSLFNLETNPIYVNINGQTKEILAGGELKLIQNDLFRWQGQDVRIDLQTLTLNAINHTNALFNNSVRDSVFNNAIPENTKYQYQSTLQRGYIQLGEGGSLLTYEADGTYVRYNEVVVSLDAIRDGAINTKQFVLIGNNNYLYYDFVDLEGNIKELLIDIPYTKLYNGVWLAKGLLPKFRNATTGITLNYIRHDNDTTKAYNFTATGTLANNVSWMPTNTYVNFAIMSSNNASYNPTDVVSKGQTFKKCMQFITKAPNIKTYGDTSTISINNGTYYQLGDKYDTLGINDGYFQNNFDFDILLHYAFDDNLSDYIDKNLIILAGTNNKLNRPQNARAFKLEASNGSATNTIELITAGGRTDTLINGDIPQDEITDWGD